MSNRGKASGREKTMVEAIRDVVATFAKDEQEVVALLIKSTQRTIQLDYDKAPPRLRPFLIHIKRNILSPELTVNSARNAARLASVNTYSTDFAKVTGIRPKKYIEEHRLQLARQVLRHTQADVYIVAFAVGYKDQNHFARTYSKGIGNPPSMEPKAAKEDVRSLLRSLKEDQYSPSDPKICNYLAVKTEPVQALGMEGFWEYIGSFSRNQIRAYILRHIDSIDIAHFELLLAKSRIQSRIDKARAEELAEAALDILRAIEFTQGVECFDEKIYGYANLANIKRMSFDLDGAVEAFRIVDRLMPDKPNQHIFLYVSFLKAVLLWWLRDEKAIVLAEEILPVARRQGSHELLARVLQLAGEIHECSGHSDRALPMFAEAVENAAFVDDTYVTFSAHYNLAYIYARLSRGEEANALLNKVKALQKEVQGSDSGLFVIYLEAAVLRANDRPRLAEAKFVEAREGFVELDMAIDAALTALDLAALYLDLNDPTRAFVMAKSAMHSISKKPFHKEAVAALALLQEAVKMESVSNGVVRQAFNHLELVRKDPTSAFLG